MTGTVADATKMLEAAGLTETLSQSQVEQIVEMADGLDYELAMTDWVVVVRLHQIRQQVDLADCTEAVTASARGLQAIKDGATRPDDSFWPFVHFCLIGQHAVAGSDELAD